MLNLRTRNFAVVLILSIALVPTYAQPEKEKKKKGEPTGTPVLWHEPVDIESRNLLLGAGGEAMKPAGGKVTFIEEKTGGHSKKYRVRDAAGNEWVAKLGKEAQTDTAANRLLWAWATRQKSLTSFQV